MYLIISQSSSSCELLLSISVPISPHIKCKKKNAAKLFYFLQLGLLLES